MKGVRRGVEHSPPYAAVPYYVKLAPMGILIFAFIILLVVALLIWALQQLPVDQGIVRVGSVVLILLAVLVIVQRAGFL